MFTRPVAELDALMKSPAANPRGPSFRSFYRVTFPLTATPADLGNPRASPLGDLRKLSLTQSARLTIPAPLPSPPDPGTGGHVEPSDGTANPPGVGAVIAWNLGCDGRSVQIADIEANWMLHHDELVAPSGSSPNPQLLNNGNPGVPLDPSADPSAIPHGTNVLGVLAARQNDRETQGIAFNAKLWAAPSYDGSAAQNISDAITWVEKVLDPGDVVLIEEQPYDGAGQLSPAESDPAVFFAIRQVAENRNIIFVEVAGNGKHDLGIPCPADRSAPASGAPVSGARWKGADKLVSQLDLLMARARDFGLASPVNKYRELLLAFRKYWFDFNQYWGPGGDGAKGSDAEASVNRSGI